ncbi:EAL domain-containing protein [Jannaschia sp. R86511]|uniref:EAL domain-containing protein n=1 Tax=Jannaschia sp. R86511 TaxID=3093853 RepID=UPI0036D2CAE4
MAVPSWSARRHRGPSLLRRRPGTEERLAASLSLLAATLESTADGILVVDRQGLVVGRNEKFARMWRLPEHLVVVVPGADDLPVLEFVVSQVADPVGFRARVEQLYANPDLVATDEIELADGRVFSRYTQPQRIEGEVVGRVWSFRDRTAERQLEQDLRRMAYQDDLTGLGNRALFMERGQALAEAAEAGGLPLGVAVLDLDNLKVVNDQLGHQAGDEMLRVAAARLGSAARAGDLVARLGGDEFGVLMPDATAATAHAVLQRMSDAMAAPLLLCGRRVGSSLSGGSSVARGQVSLEALLHEADLAMYRAKADGRGRVRAFDADVFRADPRTAVAEVEHLLADPDGLRTVLQPICRLTTGMLVGHESLTRFPGREHREVGEWFGLARDSGRGPALEARAIARARASHDPDAGTYLTLNASPAVLSSPEVLQALAGDLTGLVVEVTEDSRLDLSQLSRQLDLFRARGARVAMDDTGAGYDGLRRLVRLRPEIVKLDRELVHQVHVHPEKRALVEALVSFCRQTGASLCAEGIETVEELRALADLGVHLGQGWFVGRPGDPAPDVSREAVQACGALADVTPGDLDRLRRHLDLATDVLDVAQAAQRCLSALRADDLTLALIDGDDLVVVERPGWTTSEQRFVLSDHPATRRCLRDGLPVSVRTDDPAADAAEVRALREVGYGSVLVLPLLVHTDPLGVVKVFSRAHRSWSDRELRACRYLSEEVAGAVGRIRRLNGARRPAAPRAAPPGRPCGGSGCRPHHRAGHRPARRAARHRPRAPRCWSAPPSRPAGPGCPPGPARRTGPPRRSRPRPARPRPPGPTATRRAPA